MNLFVSYQNGLTFFHAKSAGRISNKLIAVLFTHFILVGEGGTSHVEIPHLLLNSF
jgi:hypothetical protein